jgi:hypothetical protein
VEAVRRLPGTGARAEVLAALPTRTAAAILVELKLRGDYALVLDRMSRAARGQSASCDAVGQSVSQSVSRSVSQSVSQSVS